MSSQPSTATTGVDVLVTLLSVNRINQAQFIDSDKEVLGKHWSKIWIQNIATEEVFDAIATIAGAVPSPDTSTVKASEIFVSSFFHLNQTSVTDNPLPP